MKLAAIRRFIDGIASRTYYLGARAGPLDDQGLAQHERPMMKHFAKYSAALLLGATLLVPAAYAADAQPQPSFTSQQQDEIKKMIHDYIMANPQIVSDAIEALREKEQVAADLSAKQALATHKGEIFNDPDTPVFGNPKGDVSVVEFFDYRCPYCKGMFQSLMDTVKADGNVRLVMKELPVLGPDSVVASRAAIASRNQGKYEEFHDALMKIDGPLTEDVVMKTAASVGLDTAKLKQDMDDPKVDKVIDTDLDLAKQLNITGTPGFVIGQNIMSGAMEPDSFKQVIAQARKDAKG